jgi:rod shape determining protein RodA
MVEQLLTKVRAWLGSTDWVLLLSMLVLITFGLSVIYGIDVGRGTGSLATTQSVAALIAIILFLGASRLPPAAWRSYSLVAYGMGILLLIGVLFFGRVINGARSWYSIVGFSFQPVEFMKVGMVLFLAYLIERGGRAFHSFYFFSKTALYVALPVLLILRQPDLGSAMVLFGIWLCVLLIVGIKRRYVFLLAVGLVATAVIGWFFVFAPYQKDRILTFLDPNHDPLGAGYNVQQSIIAIGAGRVFGRGLGEGSQTQLRFLPEGQTDFIFAVIGEELGFVGVSVVFLAFLFIWYRCMRIAMVARDDFGLFVTLGTLVLLICEITINIGATIGIMPVTGITLPFVSAGGSSLMMHALLLGIVAGVGRNNRVLL